MPNNYKSATRYFRSGSKSVENLQGYRYPIFAATGISPILTFCSRDTDISFLQLPVSIFKMWVFQGYQYPHFSATGISFQNVKFSGIPVSPFFSYRYLWGFFFFLPFLPLFISRPFGLPKPCSMLRSWLSGLGGGVPHDLGYLGTSLVKPWHQKLSFFTHFTWNYQNTPTRNINCIKAIKCMREWQK